MNGKVAKWWMPDDVAFVDEIPHTATGKILKIDAARRSSRTTACRRSKDRFDRVWRTAYERPQLG